MLSPMSERFGVRGALGVGSLFLLIYSGYFKGLPGLMDVPVDLTFAGVAVTVLGCLVVLLTDTKRYRAALPAVALGIVFLFGVRESMPDYGNIKIERFYLLSFAVLIGSCLLLNTYGRRRVWVVVQILFGVISLLAPDQVSRSGVAAGVAEGTNTIAAGRTVGIAVVGLLIFAFTTHGKQRTLFASAGVAAVYPMVNTGSRGPVAAAALAVALVALMAPGGNLRRGLRLLLVAGAAVAAYFLLVRDDSAGAASRVTSTLLSGNLTDTSSTTRYTIWQDALNYIPLHPLGGGWGAFSLPRPEFKLLGSLGLTYPHNVLLEVTGEAGWIAGGGLVLFSFAAIRRLRRASSDPVAAVLLGIALFATINALVSGDLSDRLTWGSLAVGWAVPAISKKRPEAQLVLPSPPPPGPVIAALPPALMAVDKNAVTLDQTAMDRALGLSRVAQ